MISRTSVLFLVALSCDAEIMINIKTNSNRNYVNINFSGHDNRLVSDNDIKLFNITKDNLNRGLRIEIGKIPENVFLKDPTPFYNLFEKYHWPEVKRQMAVNKARIVELINEEVILKTHEYVNNTTDIIKIEKKMYENVECTAVSSWSEYGYPNDEIFYNVNLDFEANHLNYSTKWRDNGVNSAIIPLGVVIKGTVNHEPGMTIASKLIANKTILLFEIEYVAKLIGNVIAHFAHLYGKYHFWAPSLSNIMKAAKLNNEIVTKEWIEVRCYMDPKLKMYDKGTAREIKLYKPIKLIHKGYKNILRVS